MRNSDQIEIIEAAYALDMPDAQWQYRLTDLVAERWGGAAASFLYDASAQSQLICERVVVRTAGELSIVDAPQMIPIGDPSVRRALFGTRPHLAQLVDLLGPELADTADSERVLEVVRDLQPGPFSVVLRTLDPSYKGLFFALPSRPIGNRMRAMWGEVAVHLGLAYRVRCALASASEATDRARADASVVRRALRVGAARASQPMAKGHEDDPITYSIGFSTVAIAEHVATLARKLGVASPLEVVRFLDGLREATQEK